MKEWNSSHPKARLMAAKRTAILAAAREAFLAAGYDGASMEGIASTSGVSIMTLYRHAANKDDLFETVVREACAYDEEQRLSDLQRLPTLPLGEMLSIVGESFQRKLVAPTTLSLLRAVIREAGRFPELAAATYAGFVQSYRENLTELLRRRPMTRPLTRDQCSSTATDFIARLADVDLLSMLLNIQTGMPSRWKALLEQAVSETCINLDPDGPRRR